MLYLNNIPYSILNNILLLGILWVLYKFIEVVFKPNTGRLFLLATSIQLINCLVFIISIFNIRFNSLNNLIGLSFPKITFDNSNTFFINVVLVYFIGLFIYLFRFFYALNQINNLKVSANFEQNNKWLSVLSHTGITIPKHLKIGISDKVTTPTLLGYLEPIILLPISICNNLSTQEIKLILIHELAHILRQDYLINLLTKFSSIVLWFNPFNYFFNKKINILREIACDEFVLQHSNEAITYSKALFQIANLNQITQSSFVMAATNGNKQELLERIRKINKITVVENKFNYAKSIFTFVLIISVFIGSFYLNPNTHLNVSKNTIDQNVTITRSPILSSNSIVVNKVKAQKNKVTKKINADNNNHQNVIALNSAENNSDINDGYTNSTKPNYDDLIHDTKIWIKKHQNQTQFASYSNTEDSIDNLIAETLLMRSIIKNYQLKKAIIAQKLSLVQDKNEALDYLNNSNEWNDIKAYEKWAKEYLGRHQQDTSLFSSTTKQKIQYR